VAPRPALLSLRALRNVLLLSAATVGVLIGWILVGLDGWRYYRTPLGVRGYDVMHGALRPSGPVGQTLGILGALLMLVPFVYMARKRLARQRGVANLRTWLDVHIFCGIVGPVLVTFHTSFKFNGLVSVAYWSMLLVALSGFVGRYLYVRIPRTIRGVEVTEGQLRACAEDVKEELQWHVHPSVMERLDAFERQMLARAEPGPDRWLPGSWRRSRHLRSLRADLRRAGVAASEIERVIELSGDRARMLRRLQHLKRTKQVFDVWHVFHLPLVWVMLVIVSLHVLVVLYFGYVPFQW
jgi:hypothetical protein